MSPRPAPPLVSHEELAHRLIAAYERGERCSPQTEVALRSALNSPSPEPQMRTLRESRSRPFGRTAAFLVNER